MTVRDIKSLFGIKPKINIPDDYIVTNEDVIRGNIFQKYSTNGTIAGTIDGLCVVDNEIVYLYLSIDYLEIVTDDFFPACGGEQPIAVNAKSTLMTINCNGQTYVSQDNGLKPINAIIAINNDLFSYSKPNLINRKANNSGINNEVDVLATYYRNRKKYEATKHIIQHINSYSSWIVENEPTDYIALTLLNNNISNKGGAVAAKVERYYSKIYCKKDSCGNKVAEKCEPGLVEDITAKSFITSTDRKNFIPNKNIIIVKEQEIGANKRSATITAKYLDFTASEELYQNEGGVATYEYKLSFDDGRKIKFIPLNTSLPTTLEVYISAKELEYIDGEFHGEKDTQDIAIFSQYTWAKGTINKDDNGIKAVIKLTEPNLDKDNDREVSLLMYCSKDKSNDIELIISQPAIDIVKEIYECNYIGKTELNSNEIDSNNVIFSIYKALVYENGEQQIVPIDDDIIKYYFSSDNNDLLEMTGLEKISPNTYCAKFINKTKHSVSDITAKVIIAIYSKDDEKLFESKQIKFIVKGTDIISNTYDLTFDFDKKERMVLWKDTEKPTFIKIISIKNTYRNGKKINCESAPFKIGLYDKNGIEKRNYDFSIKLLEDGIITFPINTSESTNDTFIITQKDTGKKITLVLSYAKKEEKIYKVPVIVKFKTKDSIKEDIWTGENSLLLIDNKISINLSPCWISPEMGNKTDIAYNGEINLKAGNHIFEIYNGKCFSANKNEPIYYKETIEINDENAIMIEIEI